VVRALGPGRGERGRHRDGDHGRRDDRGADPASPLDAPRRTTNVVGPERAARVEEVGLPVQAAHQALLLGVVVAHRSSSRRS
jgi:hypothetical protein